MVTRSTLIGTEDDSVLLGTDPAILVRMIRNQRKAIEGLKAGIARIKNQKQESDIKMNQIARDLLLLQAKILKR